MPLVVYNPSCRLSETVPSEVLPPACDNIESTLHKSTSPKRKFQAVEVHILPTFPPTDFVLVFEGFPTWLIALEPIWTKSITIVGFSSEEQLIQQLQNQGLPVSLMQRALYRFSKSKIRFVPAVVPVENQTIFLLSGSVHFIIHMFTMMKLFTQPIIASVAGHFHQCFRFGRPPTVGRDLLPYVVWHRVRHETVGGATRFVSVFGLMNCGTIRPNVTSLRKLLVTSWIIEAAQNF